MKHLNTANEGFMAPDEERAEGFGYDPEEDSDNQEKRKRKRHLIVARILTFILAIVIWLYVRTSTNVTVEQNFDVIPVQMQGITLMQEKGLDVYSSSFSHVNVTLKGTHNALSAVNQSNIVAYVDLSDVEEPGEYELTVRFQLPSGVALVNQSEKLSVTVDKTESKIFSVNSSHIYAANFSVADSCTIDFGSAKANIDYVKVTAPTLILSRIETLRLSANATITLTSSSDISATLQFLDKDGKVIVNDSIRSVAYYGGQLNENGAYVGGTVRNQISVNIPLIKEKEIPVRYYDTEGILSDSTVKITPATVTVKGSPEAVDALGAWEIGKFSAKNLIQENGYTTVKRTVTPVGLPDNITAVVIGENTYTDTMPSFTAEVKVGGTYSLTVPKSQINLVGTHTENVAVVDEGVKLTLRTVGDDTYFLLLESSIKAGKGGISLVVNKSDIAWVEGQEQASVPVTVIFSSDFEGKVYEVWEKPYRVTVVKVD